MKIAWWQRKNFCMNASENVKYRMEERKGKFTKKKNNNNLLLFFFLFQIKFSFYFEMTKEKLRHSTSHWGLAHLLARVRKKRKNGDVNAAATFK